MINIYDIYIYTFYINRLTAKIYQSYRVFKITGVSIAHQYYKNTRNIPYSLHLPTSFGYFQFCYIPTYYLRIFEDFQRFLV